MNENGLSFPSEHSGLLRGSELTLVKEDGLAFMTYYTPLTEQNVGYMPVEMKMVSSIFLLILCSGQKNICLSGMLSLSCGQRQVFRCNCLHFFQYRRRSTHGGWDSSLPQRVLLPGSFLRQNVSHSAGEHVLGSQGSVHCL